MGVKIQCRKKIFFNADPQNRCYNGCFKDLRVYWSEWEDLQTSFKISPEYSLKFWQELNEIAVQGRGPDAKIEYRIVENEDTNI